MRGHNLCFNGIVMTIIPELSPLPFLPRSPVYVDKLKALARLHRFTHLFKSLLFKNKFGIFKCDRAHFCHSIFRNCDNTSCIKWYKAVLAKSIFIQVCESVCFHCI